MVRKRIPLVTRPDQAYAFSLPQRNAPPLGQGADSEEPTIFAEASAAAQLGTRTTPEDGPRRDDGAASIQIDVRVNALRRQEPGLLACGIAPRQVIRAALRRAVKRWAITALYAPPTSERRAGEASWTVRTSVAVPAAVFDRLLAEHDPLGVDSRWSLVRGQLEPLVWAEIDALLAAFREEADGTA
ncbi:hypothetical protein [Paracoccus shanxieyensis]|uniref:Uncharacterized protein n=1 Tax=Paracoccus shanxieyensis TaxID=2675752 RepID=A0A6L6J440_9RHOB|nr:hypothetical protein [Paracoccus shanxieyensis]MTH66651.1 hypothetical protein [Paracoccus shanxieyensis]MTH89895.1 hypothetical protein [Paracoccus shanxieyensis]